MIPTQYFGIINLITALICFQLPSYCVGISSLSISSISIQFTASLLLLGHNHCLFYSITFDFWVSRLDNDNDRCYEMFLPSEGFLIFWLPPGVLWAAQKYVKLGSKLPEAEWHMVAGQTTQFPTFLAAKSGIFQLFSSQMYVIRVNVEVISATFCKFSNYVVNCCLH